jgi:hypothetical protein
MEMDRGGWRVVTMDRLRVCYSVEYLMIGFWAIGMLCWASVGAPCRVVLYIPLSIELVVMGVM